MDTKNLKPYIITLTFGGWEKRVWFMGQDNAETEKQFHQISIGLGAVGDFCSSWEEFLPKAIENFVNNGFVKVEK